MKPFEDPTFLAPSPEIEALTFSIIESINPSLLTKTIGISDEGALQKTAAAQLVDGKVRRITVNGLHAFDSVLGVLKENQAVVYGVASKDARVVTKSALPKHPGAIARTREFFQFQRAPGIWMNDFDGGPEGEGTTGDELRKKLIELCPALVDAPMLIRGSASAGLYTSEGARVSGSVGMRVYIAVADASLIAAAGKALDTLAWAAGMGWVHCGNAGQLLERMPFDTSVWQPERLDFAAPPRLKDGLQRMTPESTIYGDPNGVFDLNRLISTVDGNVRNSASALRRDAIQRMRPKQEAGRRAWVDERAPRLAAERGIDEDDARTILERAVGPKILMGDYVIELENGIRITVGDMLDNPERYHGQRCTDPLEPEYHQDNRIGFINLRSGGRPFIWSHARGGRRFNLARPSVRLLVARGQRARIADDVIAVLRERGEVFDQAAGGHLVRIFEGRAIPATMDYMIDLVDKHVEFYAFKKIKDGVEEVIVDVPDRIIKSVIARNGQRGLQRLATVISAPTLRRDGSILDAPGHDPESSILFLCDQAEVASVPRWPTEAEVVNALAELWELIQTFPFVSAVDRSVALAALITASIRASLPTAPGFGFDAPAAGTGKTLLAQVIGAMMSGVTPAVLPPVDSHEEETRKRLFAYVREDNPVLLLDNLRDPLGSASLDAFLTSPTYTDRILGSSETGTALNRSLLLVTGNNLRLIGDTCRRILVARLDAKVERPYLRRFERDPLQMVLASRSRFVVAALTVVRGWFAAGQPLLAKGSVASFEDWDRLVRQPIVWVASLSSTKERMPPIGDPIEATATALENDPETRKLESLMVAWNMRFGSKPVTVREAIDSCAGVGFVQSEASTNLAEAIEDCTADRRPTNSRALGRYLERFEGRHVASLVIRRAGISRGIMKWQVLNE